MSSIIYGWINKSSYNALCTLGKYFYWLDSKGSGLSKAGLKSQDCTNIVFHSPGYSTMCGHAVIALGRYAVDAGYVKPVVPETLVRIQCPCGLVNAYVECDDTGRTGRVRFESVPSFSFVTEQEVTLEEYGRVVYDISCGGTFYAIVDAKNFGLDLNSAPESKIKAAGTALVDHLRKSVELKHPEGDLAFLYGAIITDGQDDFDKYQETKNVCIFADGQVDRSPTGSGVQARLALQFHKGQIGLGQKKMFKNALVGSEFVGQVLRKAKCGEFEGVVVEVSGEGFYSGTAKFWCEEKDTLRNGFLVH